MSRQWKKSTACPSCQHDLQIIDGVKAPTPFAMRCPSCHCWLRVGLPARFFVAFLTVVILGLLGSIALVPVVMHALGFVWTIGYLLVLLAAYTALEIGTSMLFFTYARLEPVGKRALREGVGEGTIPPAPEKSPWWRDRSGH